MKKILCLILALLMVFSVVGCTTVGDNGGVTTDADSTEAPTTEAEITDAATTEEPTTEEATTESAITESATTEGATTEGATTEGATTEGATTEGTTTEEVTTGPADIDDGLTFRTGYARVVITPPQNVLELKGKESVADDVYATCLAIDDGEKIALFVSLDMQDLMPDGNDTIRSKISSVTKIPSSNIFLAVTHDHSGINFGAESVWSFNTSLNIANAAKAAINDLSETKMYIGTGDTTGAAWVRRYVMPDGSMTSISPGKGGAVKSVSDADASLQVVRFVREEEDKKDVVLLNWQGHLAHAVGTKGLEKALSADITHYLREDIEKADEDALVMFFAGASGNLNLNPPNEDARLYENYIEVAHAIADEALEVMEDLTRIKAGKINITRQTYKAKNAVDSAEDIAAAQVRLDQDKISPRSDLERARDRYMVARNKNAYSDLRISAIAIGDLGLVTAPYEMFDNNGVQIKEGSPFEMTIVITNSDGAWAYMPSYEAFTEYGGYETDATYFPTGMGEELVAEFLKMLNEVKKMG